MNAPEMPLLKAQTRNYRLSSQKNCSTLLCLLTRHKHSAAATAQLDEGTLTTGSLCRDLQVSELAAQNCNASADILALLRTVSTLLTVHEGPKDAQL